MSEQGDRARGAASFKPGAKELGFLLAASNHPQVLEDLQPQEQWVMPLAPGIFLLPGCSLGAASWFPAQGLSLSLSAAPSLQDNPAARNTCIPPYS